MTAVAVSEPRPRYGEGGLVPPRSTTSAATVTAGLYLWHRLGSLATFLRSPAAVTPRTAYVAWVALVLIIVAECLLSPK